MKELERTYLCQQLPEGLEHCSSKEVFDCYFPKNARHPTLRLRKNDEKMFLTKKTPLKADNSMFEEETIVLNKEEFAALQSLESKKVRKIRYFYPYAEGKICEVDVFQDDLNGLCLVDFEYETEEQKDTFKAPAFCFVEVTDKEYIAGGYLCGKKYEDIQGELEKVGYKRLS